MADEEVPELEQAAVAAHQIKSPMGTVQTILQTLLGGYVGELTDRQKDLLQSANRKCNEALQTVRELLSLAELSSGGQVEETADIADATREAHERYREEADQNGIELTLDIDPQSANVHAEAELLREAVVALVDNAIKYTPEGGRVVVYLRPGQEDAFCLSVADSGIGISEEDRDRLFEPFFRAPNAQEVVSGGTGLGLSLAKAVAQAGGGGIRAERSELGGARFTLCMPRAEQVEEEEKEPSFRAVVIGGVAAGPKVASKIMRLDPEARVTIVERGRVLSYAGCGLPYYISGRVQEQRELISTPEGLVRGPKYFEDIKDVRVMNRTEALQVDREEHRVLVRDLISGEEQWLEWDKLALAVGALPILPDIPGTGLDRIYTLHGLEHAEGIRDELAEGGAKDIVVVGGGLIGIEMTESLVEAGCRVTVVEKRSQLLPDLLDPEMADLLRRHCESKGVRVVTDTPVTGFEGPGRVERVVTERGVYPADMVIMGVGVRPNVELAEQMGLKLGRTGAIAVDEGMRTSAPDVFAAGDCCEMTHLITGEPCHVPLGSTAAKQARVAAVNICGGEGAFPGVLGTTVCKVFDHTMARSGLSEREARENGYDVVTALVPAHDRAHFMPDAAMIVLKVVADSEARRLIGIQAVGPGEAAKRVDVAVAAMSGGLSLDRIANLDLCYAPSYSDALDNLHTACNVLRNKLAGHMRGVTPAEVRCMRDRGEGFVLLDVRTHEEFDQARLEDSVHIPLSVLRARLDELPRDRPIVTFSRVSLSAYEAAIILRANGFEDVRVMDGGIIMWPYGKSEDGL
ncbi:MAG: FAD-dependent oxidoreductase [Planctomycetota bacterium]